MNYYTEQYFAHHNAWRQEYIEIAEALLTIPFQSAADFGCGNAFIITKLAQSGKDVAGFEGAEAAMRSTPEEIRSRISVLDITKPIFGERYDLVICTEVAEHIDPSLADALVHNLCHSARRWLFFSAAPPGQGGKGHVNEQPPLYWVKKMYERGFVIDISDTKRIRKHLADKVVKMWWFKNNAILFERRADVRG